MTTLATLHHPVLAPAPTRPVAAVAAPAVASVALAVAAGLHLAAAVTHEDSGLTLAFFIGVAAVQGAGAVLLAVRPSRLLRAGMIVSSVALIAIWAVSRLVGISIGHSGGPEAVGVLDGLTVAAEAIAALALAHRASQRRQGGRTLAAACLLIAVASAAGGLRIPAKGHAHEPVSGARPVAPAAPAPVGGSHAPSSHQPVAATDGGDAAPSEGTAHSHAEGAKPHPHG